MSAQPSSPEEAPLAHLADQDASTLNSSVRYAAFLRSLQTLGLRASRFIAYTSDVGEAFRPRVPPWIVKAGYGVSWAYVLGDVSWETYKASRDGPASPKEAEEFNEHSRLALAAVERGTFQVVASIALPAVTIHTAVHQSEKRLFKNVANVKLKAWLPTLVGLSVVPFLPIVYDHPVEHATTVAFGWIRRTMVANGWARRISKAEQGVEDAVVEQIVKE